MDWSKYTDEGWYGDAAIRHVLLGHWYVAGDFNPAAALPVWPLAEAVVFHFTGVSLVAARALSVFVFGGILLASYRLLDRWGFRQTARQSQLTLPFTDHANDQNEWRPSLAPAVAVLLLAVNPFCFVFTRLAILEPLLILLTLLALLAAGAAPTALHRTGSLLRRYLPTLYLGVLLPALVLTKTTGLFLFPAIAFFLWAAAGFRMRVFLRTAIPAATLALALWCGYFFLVVRPHFLSDYRYLFSANAYTGITRATALSVIHNTLLGGFWFGNLLYPLAWVAMLIALFRLRSIRQDPAPVALILWAVGYGAFLAYHNNLQPRYYLVIAVPLALLVAAVFGPALLWFRAPASGLSSILPRPALALGSALLLGLAVLGPARQTISFVMHPEYTLVDAAAGVARIIRAERTHSQLLLSISGSDISLMTGVPTICDDFGTLELAERVRLYRPGWYAAWNELDDDKMDSLTPLFHLERVAAFPAMDDPARNLLILYRLDPIPVTTPRSHHRTPTPRPLQTRVGQQPSTTQLEH